MAPNARPVPSEASPRPARPATSDRRGAAVVVCETFRPAVAMLRAGVGEAVDRVGARAWAVAIWIVQDEQLASAILVAAFARASDEGRSGPQHDASLVSDVRRKAIAARPGPPERAASGTVRSAITGLPEPQRGILELALLGRLTVPAIAATLELQPADVLSSIAGALLALRGPLSIARS
ncbi:MAG: hypothetical protein ABI317_13635 [Gaiellales bacterium]